MIGEFREDKEESQCNMLFLYLFVPLLAHNRLNTLIFTNTQKFPDNIKSDDSPEEVEQKMRDFDARMEELAKKEPDRYKRGKEAEDIPYKVPDARNRSQHQIVVKRGGRDYVITVNGNPRLAQAVNGLTNPDRDANDYVDKVLRFCEKINRWLSLAYTTLKPDFILSNAMRDMQYANTMVWVKESPSYATRFHVNFAKTNPAMMKSLYAKYRNDKLDMNDPMEAMFSQFMMNGGETGYVAMRDIEKRKKDISKELKRAGSKLSVGKALSIIYERYNEINRAVENCARFAAFVTSREMGRSMGRSIYDAKEISVNFNKKGSGAKFVGTAGQTFIGNTAALMSGLGRTNYVFWNAALQGSSNFGKATSRHLVKGLTSMAVYFVLGAINAYIGGYDDGDDDEKEEDGKKNKSSYFDIPASIRRTNMLFRAGDWWISIPLSIEFRAAYGLGELMMSTMSGKERLTDVELAEAIVGQLTQVMPLDMLEGGGGFSAFIPSTVKPIAEAYIMNKDWTGMPIYRDYDYNKHMPEWTKAYSSANTHLVGLSEAINEATGGDRYTKGWADKKFFDVTWNNPAQWEHVLEGYFGGISGTINQLVKVGEMVLSDREYDPRSIPLLNRVVKRGDERTEYRAINNAYFRLRDEYDEVMQRHRGYEKDTKSGIFDYADKLMELNYSDAYARAKLFGAYKPYIDELNGELDEARRKGDKEAEEDYSEMLWDMKRDLVSTADTLKAPKPEETMREAR